MNFINKKNISFDNLKNFKKRTLLINKLDKPSIIPNINKKTQYLFQEPENYLKLPYETNFHFVVGKKPKGPRFNSDNTVIPYSVVGNFVKKDLRTFNRKKSIIPNTISSRPLRKSIRLSKVKFNHMINETTPGEEKKKKRTNIISVTHTDVFDIFNKYKKRINKNKSEDVLKNNRKLYKDMPKTMYQYINDPLTHQERALKSIEKYNNIVKKIEKNISKSVKNKNKKNLDNTYNSSKLIKNSSTEYRMKIEKINSYEKKKISHLTLNNHVQNWEMSLRRPENFIGERREYLNVRTDNNPFWTILKEINPLENEKIINPHINKKKKEIEKNNLTSNNKMNNLSVKGKKLIDIEEKMVNQIKGNIKMINLKYDRESIKDLVFKINYSINKHSFSKK